MPPWVRWVWITLALILAGVLLWHLIHMVMLVGVALLLAAALAPAIQWLEAHRLPRHVAVALCFLGVLGAIAGFMTLLAPVLVAQTQQAYRSLPILATNLDWFRETWAGWREQYSLIPRFADMLNWAALRVMPMMSRVLDFPGQFVTGAFMTFTALFLAFFFLKDGPALRQQVLDLVPMPARAELDRVWTRAGKKVGKYVLGQLTVMALVGTLTGLGLWILGVPYPLLLGILVGLLDIVPFIGPLLGAIPGVLLAFGISWQTGLWAIGIYWGIQQLEGYLLYPYITGKAIALHPVWILLALLLGGQLFGLMGMVLAVPAAVALQVVLDESYRPRLRAREVSRHAADTDQG